MRKLTLFTLAVLTAGLVLAVTTQAQTLGRVETKRGVEVAAQVEGLRRDNPNVKAALQMFEKWGHRPKIEDAHSVSGSVERLTRGASNERGFAIRKANFAQTIREGSIELVFVPTIDAPTEWQGTMIARLYNEYNQLLVDEVFNLVMVQESTGRWSPVYELSFVSGQPFVHYQSGMYAGFALGVTIADHPAVVGSAPPTNILSWQLQEQDPYPCPYGTERIDPVRPNCDPSPLLKPVGRSRGMPVFGLASYPYMASRLSPQHPGVGGPIERFPGRCLSTGSYCYNILGLPGLIGPRVRQTAHDAFPYCVGAAITGGGLPGFARGCGSALIYQSGRHIFRIW